MNHLIPDLNNLSREQHKYLRKQKILIGTPMYGGAVMGNYLLSVTATMRWAGILNLKVDTEYLFGATYLELGRNYIANAFYNSDATHLVFIDADNGFLPNNFFELILTQKDIVGGLYPRRKVNWKAVHAAALAGIPPEGLKHCAGDFPMHPLAGHDITIGHEPQKVLSMPTGFLCITRKAFETYVRAFPERKTTPGNPGHFGIEFFRAGVQEINGSRGFDTEDNLFCKDLLTLGINTWFCPWMNVSHYGSELHEACYPCSLGHYVHFDIKPKLEVIK
jgi:hypothetical protein